MEADMCIQVRVKTPNYSSGNKLEMENKDEMRAENLLALTVIPVGMQNLIPTRKRQIR
jgi:hypothetical protein